MDPRLQAGLELQLEKQAQQEYDSSLSGVLGQYFKQAGHDKTAVLFPLLYPLLARGAVMAAPTVARGTLLAVRALNSLGKVPAGADGRVAEAVGSAAGIANYAGGQVGIADPQAAVPLSEENVTTAPITEAKSEKVKKPEAIEEKKDKKQDRSKEKTWLQGELQKDYIRNPRIPRQPSQNKE